MFSTLHGSRASIETPSPAKHKVSQSHSKSSVGPRPKLPDASLPPRAGYLKDANDKMAHPATKRLGLRISPRSTTLLALNHALRVQGPK